MPEIPGIHPAKKPMEGGFSLGAFLQTLRPEDAMALGVMLDAMDAEKEAGRKAAEDATGALHLLARIREALGDNGARMQDELLEYCAELRDAATERDRYRSALEKIALMGCRCIDNGQPCVGCTKAGREAPALAYKTLNS